MAGHWRPWARVRRIALDKTAPLTRNRPVVVEVVTVGGVTRQQVLALAAALEARSEPSGGAGHPGRRRPAHLGAAEVEAVPGAG